MIIGLTGYAQHGKDTVGKVLVEEYGFTRFAFADALRKMARDINPTIALEGSPMDVIDQLRENGQLITASIQGHLKLSVLLDSIGYELTKQIPDARTFYQRLGTDGVRDNLGDDTWVNATGKAIADAGVTDAVICDARFPNEFAWVKARGELWKVVRLNADGSEFDNGVGKTHPSEQFIETAPYSLALIAEQIDTLRTMARAGADGINRRYRPVVYDGTEGD